MYIYVNIHIHIYIYIYIYIYPKGPIFQKNGRSPIFKIVTQEMAESSIIVLSSTCIFHLPFAKACTI